MKTSALTQTVATVPRDSWVLVAKASSDTQATTVTEARTTRLNSSLPRPR